MRTFLLAGAILALLPCLEGATKRPEPVAKTTNYSPKGWSAKVTLQIEVKDGKCGVKLIAPPGVTEISNKCSPAVTGATPDVRWLEIDLTGTTPLPVGIYLGGLDQGPIAVEIPAPKAKKIHPASLQFSTTQANDGGWTSNTRLEAAPAHCALVRLVAKSASMKMTCKPDVPEAAISSDPGFLTLSIHGTDTDTLPQAAYLMGLEGEPIRIEIPPFVPTPIDADHFVTLALCASLVTVVAGLLWAGKSPWKEMGKQGWTFESWSTNASVAVALGLSLTKLLPGWESPYSTLSAIFGIVAAAAPIAYNMTTRKRNETTSGLIVWFGCSAVMTGLASFGQVLILHHALVTASPGTLSGDALTVLRWVFILIGGALAYHMVTSVHDTVDQQSTKAADARGVFPAL